MEAIRRHYESIQRDLSKYEETTEQAARRYIRHKYIEFLLKDLNAGTLFHQLPDEYESPRSKKSG